MSQFPPAQQTYQMPPQSKPAGMAIASLVLGIIGVVTFCAWYLAIPCAIVAICLGAIAKGKVNRGEAGGGGMAKAGIILGIVSLILTIVFWVSIIFVATKFGPEIQKKFDEAQQQQLQRSRNQQNNPLVTPSPTPAETGPEAPKGNTNPLAKP